MTKRMALALRRAAKLATERRMEAHHARNRGWWDGLTDEGRADWMLERARRIAPEFQELAREASARKASAARWAIPGVSASQDQSAPSIRPTTRR